METEVLGFPMKRSPEKLEEMEELIQIGKEKGHLVREEGMKKKVLPITITDSGDEEEDTEEIDTEEVDTEED